MNFAAPAILLVLILLPGVIFRVAYIRGQWDSHPFRAGAISEEIAYGAAMAIVLHLLGSGLLHLTGRHVQYDDVLAILYGPAPSNSAFPVAIQDVGNQFEAISGYLVSLYAGAWLAGYALHAFVRFGKLDLQTKTFRFPHDWHYLMSGEISDFGREHGPFQSQAYKATLVAVLLDQSGESFVYRGVLRRYHYDSSGQLDRLVLEHPERASFTEIRGLESSVDGSDTDAGDALFVSIEGHYLVVFVKDISNINILFVTELSLQN